MNRKRRQDAKEVVWINSHLSWRFAPGDENPCKLKRFPPTRWCSRWAPSTPPRTRCCGSTRDGRRDREKRRSSPHRLPAPQISRSTRRTCSTSGVVPMPWMDVAAMNNNWAYCTGGGEARGIGCLPARNLHPASWWKLNRIASHLLAFGTYGIEDIGAFTPFLYAFPRAGDDPQSLRGGSAGAPHLQLRADRRRLAGPPGGWTERCKLFVAKMGRSWSPTTAS